MSPDHSVNRTHGKLNLPVASAQRAPVAGYSNVGRFSMPHTSRDTWRWGKELVACFDELKAELGAAQPAVIDREIIPDFSGRLDGLVLWLICDRMRDVGSLEAQAENFRALFVAAMRRHQFPQSAIDSLRLEVTSQEQIKNGGGRFAYFR